MLLTHEEMVHGDDLLAITAHEKITTAKPAPQATVASTVAHSDRAVAPTVLSPLQKEEACISYLP